MWVFVSKIIISMLTEQTKKNVFPYSFRLCRNPQKRFSIMCNRKSPFYFLQHPL